MMATDIGRCLWRFERSGARIERDIVPRGLAIIDWPYGYNSEVSDLVA